MMLVVFLGFLPSPGQAALVSTFDSDTEGWTAINDYKDFMWVASGGQSGGYIQATDKSLGATWYFVSPDSWDGDWRAYEGGKLDYYIKLISYSGSFFTAADVKIIGSAGTVGKKFITSKPGDWTHYEVPLTHTFFEVDQSTFQNVLADVTALHIRGEYISGSDTEGLDTVSVTPIPLPAGIWFLGTGLVGLWVSRRKTIL